MDGFQGEIPPNLADILATLSRLAPAPPVPTTQGIEAGQIPFQHVVDSVTDDTHHPQLPASQTDHNRPNEQTIDPATITEWASGLRCVSKLSTQNPAFGNAIRNVRSHQAFTKAALMLIKSR